MKTLKQIQKETKIEYTPQEQPKLPLYLTQVEKHDTNTGRLEVLWIIAAVLIAGFFILLAVILGA